MFVSSWVIKFSGGLVRTVHAFIPAFNSGIDEGDAAIKGVAVNDQNDLAV
jgi:hypothetical protein